MSNNRADILSVKGLDVFYGDVQALYGVDLFVKEGEIVGIVGESGSGKTTLLRTIAHMLPGSAWNSAGSIILEGKDIARFSVRDMRKLRGNVFSYLFQNAEKSFDPLFTIRKQFDEMLRAHSSDRQTKEELLTREIIALKRVGFRDSERILSSLPSELSGGMCQRVALAFALSSAPKILFADEPTSALDGDAQATIIELLRDINSKEELAVLIVSHDIELVASFANRIVVMHEGRIVEQGSAEQIMKDPQHAYTQELIEAIPHLNGDEHIEYIGSKHAS